MKSSCIDFVLVNLHTTFVFPSFCKVHRQAYKLPKMQYKFVGLSYLGNLSNNLNCLNLLFLLEEKLELKHLKHLEAKKWANLSLQIYMYWMLKGMVS